MAELIRLGAYQRGSDPNVDEAIRYFPALEAYLGQGQEDRTELSETYERLADVLGMNAEVNEAAVDAVMPERNAA